VLLTPHTAGLTVESRRRMSLGAARATLSLLRGELPAHVVNPQVLERWAWRR
jgi:D-3-phosphoglycerate dehydrogenase